MTWIEDLDLLLPDAPARLPDALCEGDIRVLWDNGQGIGDWELADGDLQTGQDMETACLVSLFSDRLATPDHTPSDGSGDRRGWWADTYEDNPIGSNIWQLERAKKTRDTLGQARSFALVALQWLIDDGLAKLVLCNTMWAAPNLLGIALAIIKPDGTTSRFAFGWAWNNLAALRSPIRLEAPPTPTLEPFIRIR